MKTLPLFLCAAALAARQQGIDFYSIEQEIALGDRLAAEVQRQVTVVVDPRVDRIGAALAPKASPFRYHFVSFGGPEPAGGAPASAAILDETIAIPGGWVFVPRRLLARDDRQLAAILAHAIAHIELRHGTRLLTKRELAEIGRQTAAAIPPPVPPDAMAAAMLNFRRRYERAADLHAIQLLKNAGFDPAGLIDYLRTLPAPEHSMLSPYPLPEHRIAAAEKAIAAR